jgi:addiction module RelE/StbE family toxin
MWKILEHRQADKELSSGRVPVEILKRYEKWKDIATISGPDGLRAIRGFHDEALAGEWKGCRSSRLNEQWRVIYSIEAGVMTVLVIRVTPHDYRRR